MSERYKFEFKSEVICADAVLQSELNLMKILALLYDYIMEKKSIFAVQDAETELFLLLLKI